MTKKALLVILAVLLLCLTTCACSLVPLRGTANAVEGTLTAQIPRGFTPQPTSSPSPSAITPPASPQTNTLTPTLTPTSLQTPTPSSTATLSLSAGYEKVCQNAPPSPFAEGAEGYICNRDRILIRTKASQQARIIGVLVPNTRFVVVGGPECGNHRVWWQVRIYIENKGYVGMTGWMPESDPGGQELYLCPLP